MVETHQQKYSSTHLVHTRICARPKLSAGRSETAVGYSSSRYSQITVLSVMTLSPSTSAGTCPRGLIALNQSAWCSNRAGSRRLASNARPFSNRVSKGFMELAAGPKL
jgi:hypothetical protein